MKSKFLTIDRRDVIKGIFVAFLTTVLTGMVKLFESGVSLDWMNIKPVLTAGICAAMSYLIKCLVSNSRDELFAREPEY